MHFSDLLRKVDKSARLPNTNDSPPNKMDLPAPVSPVIQVNPLEKDTFSLSMSA